MRTGSPAAPRRRNRDCQSTRCPCLAATTYAHADPVRSSSTAMGRRAHCTELWHREDLLDWLLSNLRRLGKLAAHVAKLLVLRQSQFFDHTRSRKRKAGADATPSTPAPPNSAAGTPLRIP